MTFVGVSRTFSTKDCQQYETIGAFWDEMSKKYGLENLQGLGYSWTEDTIDYAIGLKVGTIDEANCSLTLPSKGWTRVFGQTDNLAAIYREIYEDGPLTYEIEIFTEDGNCTIMYYRKGETANAQY